MIITKMLVVVFLIYSFLIVFPLKLKIIKKNGRLLSNKELLALADGGDPEAGKIKKLSKYLVLFILIIAAVFIAENKISF